MTHLLSILRVANAAALAALPMLVGCAAAEDDNAPRNQGTTGTGGNLGAGGNATGRGGSAGQTSGGASAAGAPGAVDPSCGLPDAAFCDPFNKPSPGGRAGDLDDAMWSYARLGTGCNVNGAGGFAFPATPLNICGVWQTVQPGGPDSQFCVTEDGDPRWTEAFEDNTDYMYISAMNRQPFDFEGRTGTVQWEADARTAGSHTWWLETWFTDQPAPGSNLHGTDQLVTTKEGLGISLALDCGQTAAAGTGTSGSGLVGVNQIVLVHDYQYQDVYDPFVVNDNSRCVKTEQGKLNKFQFKLSTNRIEVWASDVGSDTLKQIAAADIDLRFSRAWVQLSHVHYNARKENVSGFQSYQWARFAFDGPRLTPPRAYEIADPLTKVPADSTCFTNDVYRIAYGVTNNVAYDLSTGPSRPTTLTFTDVDPTDAVSARLNFNTSMVASGDTISYRFNSKQWQYYTAPAIQGILVGRRSFSVPVPIADLVPGNNTVEFGTNSVPAIGMPPNSMEVSNIDLEIEVP